MSENGAVTVLTMRWETIGAELPEWIEFTLPDGTRVRYYR